MINELYRSFKAEMQKYKGTYAMALAVAAPLFISLLMAVIYFFKAEKLVRTGTNGLTGMLDGGVNASATMLFTFYLVMLTILIHQVEHRAHALKDVFSYPVSHLSTYTSKWMISFLLTGLSVALYFIFSLLFTWIVELRHPTLVWFDKDIFLHFMKQVILVMIASLFLMGIQFLVALRWSNAIVPLGVGVTGFISAIILAQGWKHIDVHPYALGLLSYMKSIERVQFTLGHLITYSSIGLVVTMIAGYFMWCKRRIV